MNSKRNLWPIGLVAAFVVFFAGMALVVFIASTHGDSLVEKNYYEQELKFQGRINDTVRGNSSGAGIAQDAAGKIIITIPVAHLARQCSGTIQFYRASDSELDRELPLQPDATGVQTLDAAGLADGRWSVRLRWTSGGENYFIEKKIIVASK